MLLLAEAFPASTFTGYDISQYALARANERAGRERRSTNATFSDPREAPMPTDRSLDLVTTFDCIHDMTDPQGMMHVIRDAVARRRHVAARRHQGTRHVRGERRQEPDGVADVRDQRALVHVVGAVSEPGGAGLGTLGLSERRPRQMAEEAGFTQFRKLPVDHAVNAFYEVRP